MQELTHNAIRRQLAMLMLEGTSIEDILQQVCNTNWEDWIAEVQTEKTPCTRCYHIISDEVIYLGMGPVCQSCDKELEIERKNRPVPCKYCKQLYPYYTLNYITRKLPRGIQSGLFCVNCMPMAEDVYKVNCILCNQRYLPFRSKNLCDTCFTDKYRREYMRVHDHNQRAIEMHLPANITLKQWIATLDYFNWRCAYCLNSFKSLEHYMPLSLNGGSTVDNCLPSCYRCNTTKRDKHPSEFSRLFPSENIARIEAYFSSLERTLPA